MRIETTESQTTLPDEGDPLSPATEQIEFAIEAAEDMRTEAFNTLGILTDTAFSNIIKKRTQENTSLPTELPSDLSSILDNLGPDTLSKRKEEIYDTIIANLTQHITSHIGQNPHWTYHNSNHTNDVVTNTQNQIAILRKQFGADYVSPDEEFALTCAALFHDYELLKHECLIEFPSSKEAPDGEKTRLYTQNQGKTWTTGISEFHCAKLCELFLNQLNEKYKEQQTSELIGSNALKLANTAILCTLPNLDTDHNVQQIHTDQIQQDLIRIACEHSDRSQRAEYARLALLTGILPRADISMGLCPEKSLRDSLTIPIESALISALWMSPQYRKTLLNTLTSSYAHEDTESQNIGKQFLHGLLAGNLPSSQTIIAMAQHSMSMLNTHFLEGRIHAAKQQWASFALLNDSRYTQVIEEIHGILLNETARTTAQNHLENMFATFRSLQKPSLTEIDALRILLLAKFATTNPKLSPETLQTEADRLKNIQKIKPLQQELTEVIP